MSDVLPWLRFLEGTKDPGQMESLLITTICCYSLEVMCGRKQVLIWEWLVDMSNKGKEF